MRVKVFGTGGTISGHSDDPLDYRNYQSGRYTIDDILERAPDIHRHAEIVTEQFTNFSSRDMTPEHWVLLKRKIEDAFVHEHCDGVVITHGTNTLEETAYFLHLTVHSEKPVVLVGAQRPLSSVGTDAVINLINAIRVAAAPQAVGKGVLVVLNDEIHCAREVTKTNTYRLETFQSGQLGFLGYVDPDGTVQFYRAPTRKHTVRSCFSTLAIDRVPKVGIVYSYAGSNGDWIRSLISSSVSGIVMAGTGAGKFTRDEEAALAEAAGQGIAVALSSRVGNGRVVAMKEYEQYPFITADNLIPQKARILLMLSLMLTKDRHEIQKIFDAY